MHEFSTAQQIMQVTLKVAKEKGVGRVVGIRLELGGLSHLNEDQLRFALIMLAEGTLANGARIEISHQPVIFKCSRCSFKEKKVVSSLDYFELLAHSKCKRCSERVEVDGEAGCIVKNIEVKK